MPRRAQRHPEWDLRVVQIDRDLQKLNRCMQRVACGSTFNYCYLDQIGQVIRGKEQLYSEAVVSIQRLARRRHSTIKHARASCGYAKKYKTFCHCRSCDDAVKLLDEISYETEVFSNRKSLLKQIISCLKRVRDNAPSIRPAF